MEHRLQMILLIVTIMLLIYIIYMVKKNALELKYSLAWIFASLGLIVFAAVPKLLDWVAVLIGVKALENAIFLLAIGLELVILFSMTILTSRNSVRIRKMAQEMALLHKIVDDMHREIAVLTAEQKRNDKDE